MAQEFSRNGSPEPDDGWAKVPHGLWTLDLPTGAIHLLGWLHSHSDPFLAKLTMNKCRRTFGTSKIALWFEALEAVGFVTVTKGGNGQPAQIVVHDEPYFALRRPRPNWRANRAQTGALCAPKLARIEEQGEEQLEEQNARALSRTKSTHAEQEFERFWEMYPRKISKARARTAWNRVKILEYAQCATGLAAWKAHWTQEATADRFIPHPASWLNGREWENPPSTRTKERPGLHWDESRRIWIQDNAG